MPPINKPATTNGLDRSKVTLTPSNAEPLTLEKYFTHFSFLKNIS